MDAFGLHKEVKKEISEYLGERDCANFDRFFPLLVRGWQVCNEFRLNFKNTSSECIKLYT